MRRFIASIAIVAALGVGFVRSAAADPQSGGGLTPTTWDCINADGAPLVATFNLPGAFLAPGPGALKAPFPGLLVAVSPDGAAPLGTYQVLPPLSHGQKAGLTSGELSCELVIDGSPVPPALNVAPTGH